MFGYLCKYVPVELLEAMGMELKRIEPEVSDYTQAETYLHANMCSFIKSVLEDVLIHDYEGIILTACCDSTRRLYDALKEHFPNKFVYLLDLPHKINDFAVRLYTDRIREMIAELETYSSRSFQLETLERILEKPNDPDAQNKQTVQTTETACGPSVSQNFPVSAAGGSLRIGLMGARCSKEIMNLLQQNEVQLLFDLTCTGIVRDTYCRDHTLFSYVESLLGQIPCMRMIKAVNRQNFVQGFLDRIDGILYHTVKFCDIYAYEYAAMKDNLTVPLLSIETDATSQCAGQIRTRVEAFLESLQQKKSAAQSEHVSICSATENSAVSDGRPTAGRSVSITIQKGKPMYLLGIDSGSTSTNAVLINEKKEILTSYVTRTGAKSGDSALRAYEEILKKANITADDLTCTVSTGYGRISIPFADKNLTEISCHGKGAHFLNPDIRTILDIGGQDSKGIRLNENGEVADFVMNDKCAAGTGRFLEMMARTLEIDITELGPVSLNWKEDIEISSMCSVFAESEVISLIAQNKEKSDIAHGIHKAIANKSLALLRRIHMEPGFMMTGGVAQNPGVVNVLEETLGEKLFIYKEPEIIGALGAALYGLEQL